MEWTGTCMAATCQWLYGVIPVSGGPQSWLWPRGIYSNSKTKTHTWKPLGRWEISQTCASLNGTNGCIFGNILPGSPPEGGIGPMLGVYHRWREWDGAIDIATKWADCAETNLVWPTAGRTLTNQFGWEDQEGHIWFWYQAAPGRLTLASWRTNNGGAQSNAWLWFWQRAWPNVSGLRDTRS